VLALPLAALLLLPQEVETLTETLADGTVVVCEVVRDESGAAVRDGSYEETWPDGSRRASGRYKDGLRHGRWRSWHASGENASSGKYDEGLRDGKWTVWREDGSVVDEESGEFAVLELEYEGGAPRSRGETRGGVRHGSWTFYWENGVPKAGGVYVEDELSGPWWFRHADGTLDPDWISGHYLDGRRVGPLSTAVAAEQAALEVSIPEARRSSTSWEAERLLEHLHDGDERRREKAREELWEAVLDDAFLTELVVRLDPANEAELRLAEDLVAARLKPVWSDYLLWAPPAESAGAEERWLDVLRWTSFAHVTDAEYRTMTLAFEHGAARAELERSGASLAPLEPLIHPPLSDGSRVEVPSRVAESAYRERFAERDGGEERKALDRALAWLVAHQEADGSWDPDGFMEHCDEEPACGDGGEGHHVTGVTAIALLALLGDGNTTYTGEHRAAVGRALRWLITAQHAKTGIVGKPLGPGWIYCQGAATVALAEAAFFSDDGALRTATRNALAPIRATRNPYGAWRYDMPPTGESDTSVTGWMVAALVSAERAGVTADPDALLGARVWIDSVTDPQTGRCGYDTVGGFSSRVALVNEDWPPQKGEAMTAVALLSRLLLGQSPTEPILVKHAQLLLETPPEWDPEGHGCDMYYWYYGTLAMAQMPEREYWRPWWKALCRAALESQRTEGHAAGSWDPVGPWGYAGGRVYSTAMMALCLEAPRRFVRSQDHSLQIPRNQR